MWRPQEFPFHWSDCPSAARWLLRLLPVKWYYAVLLLGLLIGLMIVLCQTERLETAIQALSAFAAAAAAIIAVAVVDPPAKRVRIAPCPVRWKGHEQDYSKADILARAPEHADAFKAYPDPFYSYRVYFRLVNKSGFELKGPMISIDALADRRHPSNPDKGNYVPYLNNDCQMLGPGRWQHEKEDVWSGEKQDRQVIICPLKVNWHRKDHRDFYVRMVLDNGSGLNSFKVNISVTCENAEGWIEPVEIRLEDLRLIQ